MIDSSQQPVGEDTLFRRFKTSVISYGLRQIVVTGLALLTNIILTHYLLPGQFGQVAVVMIVITVATLLADGGLGVYLIQRHAEIDEHDLSRVTTIQLLASVSIMSLSFLVALGAHQFVEDETLGIMLAVASVSLPLQVVRGMALLVLERALLINKVVRVELIEQIAYMFTAIFLAQKGAGAWSIVIAHLCKSSVGLLAAVFVGKFRFRLIRPIWDNDLKKGLKFGFHYQAALLINMARVSVIPLYIVPFFGFEGGGFVERSWYFAGAPLGILLAIQNRTIFPYISRIQFDLAKIRTFTQDSIYISAIIDKIMFLPLLILAPDIIQNIFNKNWLPMLPLIYWLLAGNIIFGALSGTLYPLANGIGKSDLISKLNLITFILSWILIIVFTQLFGIVGVGIASLVLWGGIDYMKTIIARQIGPFVFYRQIFKPLIAFIITWGCTTYLFDLYALSVSSIYSLVFWSIIIGMIYILFVVIIDSRRLKHLFKTFRTNDTASDI